jgi:5'-AMP-activated protein kinase catalytic alpha subunit
LHKVEIDQRYLKSENIIIEQGKKEIKLIDFGLINIHEDGQLLYTTYGNPCYSAPEMLEGKSYKGSTVDIWSAGIVLFYMLCGYFPFEDSNNDKLYKKICKGKFEIPKFLSKNAKDLISKILVVNIQRRINIKDIKKHPWVLNYLEKDKSYGNIFKHIGLNTNKYIIPIDEDIVDEISTKYNIDKIQIRENILFDIISDVSTLYKLILYKKCKENIKSVADLKSELYQNYIKDKNNLLSTYNNDLKLVFNKRKNGVNEKDRILKDSKSYENIKKIKVNDNKRTPMTKKSCNCISKNITINKSIMSIKKNKKESAKNLSYKYLTLNDDKNMKQILREKKDNLMKKKILIKIENRIHYLL